SSYHAPRPPVPYTLSLHDALPIWLWQPWARKLMVALLLWGLVSFVIDIPHAARVVGPNLIATIEPELANAELAPDAQHDKAFFIDRKSTRLNSSHVSISYAVFCLK